jgi:hypothetical protein
MTCADRQAARDAQYSEAYRAWVDSLPPAERAQLAAGGLAQPDATRRTNTRQPDDTRLERHAAPEPTPDAVAEDADDASPADATADQVAASASAVLASFCARIRSHPNPMLAFDAACFASGLMDIEGLSEAALAERHGVTRAGFSKLVVQWSETFGLPPSRGMRSKRARRIYRLAQLTSHTTKHDRTQN